MPEKNPLTPPAPRRHKPTNRAYIRVNGKMKYLGRWDDKGMSAEAKRRYHEFLRDWATCGGAMPDKYDITIAELVAAYWRHAKTEYVDPGGNPTTRLECLRHSLKPLLDLYPDTLAAEFGPKSLRAIRQIWIDAGLSRSTVNDRVSDIRRCFKWAASHEYIPAGVFEALRTVEGLRRGKGGRETEAVQPVPMEHVEAAKAHLPSPLAAAVDLQLLSGARPAEILNLTPADIDTSKDPWEAELRNHKTAYRGRDRRLFFGQRAQAILRRFMLRDADKPLFNPREAEAERHSQASMHRRPNQAPNPRKTSRTLREQYDTASYRRAIKRACGKAGVPAWRPNQLRHNAATLIRQQHGIEAAQVVLGHAELGVTQVYAERDFDKARRVIAEIG
ncbi:MAG: tyrosine-type recombinase/integrase [Candidatus Hydrogenedentota bacterium]